MPDQVAISPEHASKVAVSNLSNPPASLSVPQSSEDDGSSTTDLGGVSSTWDEFPNGRFGDPTSPAYGVGSGDQWDPGAGGLGVSVSFSREFHKPNLLRYDIAFSVPKLWRNGDPLILSKTSTPSSLVTSTRIHGHQPHHSHQILFLQSHG